MISVHDFARQNSIWREIFPALDQVVRWINASRYIVGNPVPDHSPSDRNPLIAELAFRLTESGIEPDGLSSDEVAERAREAILALPRGEVARQRIYPGEWHEAQMMSRNLHRFLGQLQTYSFSPLIPGCGVVDRAEADIRSGAHLIEVKAVQRTFRGGDLRQMLTYCSMLYAHREAISEVTLINPRAGYYRTVRLADIAAGASGKSHIEVMQTLVESMTGLQVSA